MQKSPLRDTVESSIHSTFDNGSASSWAVNAQWSVQEAKPTKKKTKDMQRDKERLKTLDTDPRLEEGRHGSREQGFERHVE